MAKLIEKKEDSNPPVDRKQIELDAKEARRLELNDNVAKMRKLDSDYTHSPRHRRKIKKMKTRLQESFTFCSESYVNEVIEAGFDFNSDKAVGIFDKWNNIWKYRAKKVIHTFNDIIDTREKRESVIYRFELFVDNLLERSKESSKEQSKPEKETIKPPAKAKNENKVTVNGKMYEIPIVLEALEEAGIKTKAKTVKGIERVINKCLLHEPTRDKLVQFLSIV